MLPEEKPRRVSFERERGVTEIHITPNIAYVLVRVPEGEDITHHRLRILEILRDGGISLFLIKLQRNGISFGIDSEAVAQVENLLQPHGYALAIHQNRVILSVFGQNMRELYGVMATVAEALYEAGAPIEQAGDAHNRVSCLIDAGRAPMAVDRLRKAFGLSEFAIRWGGEKS